MIAFFSVVRRWSRVAAARPAARVRRRSRGSAVAVSALVALLSAGCGSSASTTIDTTATHTTTTHASRTTPANGAVGPEGIPLENGPPLAPAASTRPGTAVDGIQCAPVEQLAYHIHAHLQVYVDGRPRALPGAIGMVQPVAQQTPYGPFYGAQGCYYWLHTHTNDGIIHIESPVLRLYTLGVFFDVWRQTLSRGRVAGARGRVVAFINGRRWTRSPRQLPLLPHAVIQLDVGSPVVPFASVSWAGTKL